MLTVMGNTTVPAKQAHGANAIAKRTGRPGGRLDLGQFQSQCQYTAFNGNSIWQNVTKCNACGMRTGNSSRWFALASSHASYEGFMYGRHCLEALRVLAPMAPCPIASAKDRQMLSSGLFVKTIKMQMRYDSHHTRPHWNNK